MKRALFILLAFALAVPLIPFVVIGEMPAMEWMERSTGMLSLLYGVILLAADILLPLPSSLIAVFMGAQQGWTAGVVSIFLGLLTGSLIGYGLGWHLGRPMMDRLVPQRSQELYSKLENRMSYWALALSRSIPLLAEASVLAAGVARLEFKKTLPLLLISNLGLAILYGSFGYFGAKEASPALLFIGGIAVPACGILILFLLFGKSIYRRPSPDRI